MHNNTQQHLLLLFNIFSLPYTFQPPPPYEANAPPPPAAPAQTPPSRTTPTEPRNYGSYNNSQVRVNPSVPTRTPLPCPPQPFALVEEKCKVKSVIGDIFKPRSSRVNCDLLWRKLFLFQYILINMLLHTGWKKNTLRPHYMVRWGFDALFTGRLAVPDCSERNHSRAPEEAGGAGAKSPGPGEERARAAVAQPGTWSL